MILLSSIRQFSKDGTGEYQRNQLAAKATWERVASKIVYFSAREPSLDSTKTIWIPSDEYPQILTLCEFAGQQNEWCAILNADIVLAQHFPIVEAKLKARKAMCASSWRYNFDPAVGIDSGVKDDEGLDFFAAVPAVWQKDYELVDERLRLGSGFWDSHTLSVFCTFFASNFWNITNSRVIFHPRHGGRIYGPGVHCDSVQTYGWPTMSSAHL